MLCMEASGKTKVGELNMATAIQKNVVRLDVAVLSLASKI